MKGSASSRPEGNLNHGEVQQTVLWREMLNKFSLILSLLRKVYLEAFSINNNAASVVLKRRTEAVFLFLA